MKDETHSRRQILGAFGAVIAASTSVASRPADAQAGSPPQPPPASRSTTSTPLAPRAELVNTLEFEEQARMVLGPEAFAPLAGSDRRSFDRITLRPRMMVPTTDLDLGLSLFGDTFFAPIVVGPVNNQRRFHPDGELATAAGASAANAALIVSQPSVVPIESVLAATTSPCWVQVFASDPTAGALVRRGTTAGCKAVCITVGATPATETSRGPTPAARIDWAAVDSLRRGITQPVLIKGITTPDAAREALRHGVQGLIVSDYGSAAAAAGGPILALAAILDVVDGRVPVLIDGSFRRGTDIIKALAFGARAVVVSRPVMWGLAAYGADGVQGVVEMLQTELARYMCMCGRASLTAITPAMLQVHADPPGEARPRG